MRRSRPGSLGSVLPISLVEPDGLIVTTDGRYIRVIECDRVPNTITADPSELRRIEDCFAHLCRIIPDRQGLVVLAQTIRSRSATRWPAISARQTLRPLGTGLPGSPSSPPRACD